MRKHIWLLSGLLILAASAPSRADFTVRLGGDPAADVPFQTLVDNGDATVEPMHWGRGARIAVGSVRFGLSVGARAVGYHGGYGRYHGGYGGYYGGYGRYYGGYGRYYGGYGGYYGGYRPYHYGGYGRPYYSWYHRPYAYWGYRPYYSAYYRPYYYGGYYSSYYYPSYSYYDPYYYGCNYSMGSYGSNSYSAPPPNVYSGAPVMPSAPAGDGTYPYDGGPQGLPYPGAQPAPMTNPQPRPTVPREGRIVLLTASSPAPAYPAYGEERSRTGPAELRVVSRPVTINYPAYGDAQTVQTVAVRSGTE